MAIQTSADSNFNEMLQQNEKVIVKYYADWCGSCKLFAPKFRRLSEDERFAGTVFLDVNAEENPEARKKAGVDTLPYFAVFKKGELVSAVSTSKEEVVTDLLQKLN